MICLHNLNEISIIFNLNKMATVQQLEKFYQIQASFSTVCQEVVMFIVAEDFFSGRHSRNCCGQ